MAEIRETKVERDAEGRVTGHRERVERTKRGGGFGWGLLLGIVLVAAAIVFFAYSQGSFQSAGIAADEATVAAQEEAGAAIESTGDALKEAGQTAENATDSAAN